MTKRCPHCKEHKELTEFHKNKSKKDGLQPVCKKCRKIYTRKHYLKNKKIYMYIEKKRNQLKNKKIILEIKKLLNVLNVEKTTRRFWISIIEMKTKNFLILVKVGY